MRTAWRNFWAFFSALFRALERGGNAIDHVAQYAEEEAESFNAVARIERKKRLAAKEEELGEAITIPSATATTATTTH